ncbi:MAG: YihA family ribosome biogenesis GTP-binding protein [Oscillospiraceae bacterium]|nr:YihA family ribosome biogenesis GTP-binding protein [Oscillospiraceae bacterium]
MTFKNAEFQSACGTSEQLPQSTKPEIIFAGKSNVGKSSLINKLTGRKSLARISSKPGKTGTINFYNVDNFHLVDLPGYGYAKVSKQEKERWSELMEGYFAQERAFCLVVQLLDMRHKPTQDDFGMINFLYENGFPYIVVLTKMDKLKKSEKEKNLIMIGETLKEFENIGIFPFSAQTGEGADSIIGVIEECVEEYLKESEEE